VNGRPRVISVSNRLANARACRREKPRESFPVAE
jgi:hypothetical protein